MTGIVVVMSLSETDTEKLKLQRAWRSKGGKRQVYTDQEGERKRK